MFWLRLRNWRDNEGEGGPRGRLRGLWGLLGGFLILGSRNNSAYFRIFNLSISGIPLSDKQVYLLSDDSGLASKSFLSGATRMFDGESRDLNRGNFLLTIRYIIVQQT